MFCLTYQDYGGVKTIHFNCGGEIAYGRVDGVFGLICQSCKRFVPQSPDKAGVLWTTMGTEEGAKMT